MRFNGVNDNSTQGKRYTQTGCKFTHTNAATITMTPDGLDSLARVIVKNQGGRITSVILRSALTCALTTAGAGGLDTGSEANNKGYYVFLITKPNGKVPKLLCSLSETSPTMPSGYPFCSDPLWFISNNGDGDIREFVDSNGWCYYTEVNDCALVTSGIADGDWAVLDASVHAPNNSRVLLNTYCRNKSSSQWNSVRITFDDNDDSSVGNNRTIHHANAIRNANGAPGSHFAYEHPLVAAATGIYYFWALSQSSGGTYAANFSMYLRGWTLT